MSTNQEPTATADPTAVHRQRRSARGYLIVLGVAALIGAAGLGLGFFTDDYLHLATIDGRDTPAHSKWNLFTFADGNPEHMRHFQSTGPHPWFALPQVKLHFFRPLASALMVLDRAAFGDWAAGYHVVSALWYLALAATLMLLFREWLPGGIGVLALLIFAIDEGHAVPLGWWCNRHAIVSAVPAVLGLTAHIRWREQNWKPGLPLSLAGFALGLLGGETAIGVMGYLGAYELFAAPGAARKRLSALVPAAALSVLYLYLYGRGGFGTYGSQEYIDPLHEKMLFLRNVPDRFFGMVGNLFLSLPPEVHVLLTRLQWGLVALAILAPALFFLWPRLSVRERRAMRWLVPGGAIAGLPTLGAAPSSRLYLMPSIAAAAVIAVIIHHTWAMAWKRRNLPWKTLLVLLGALHIVLATAFWPATIVFFGNVTGRIEASAQEFQDRLDLAGKHVIVLNSPEMMYTVYLPYLLAEECLPASWWADTLDAYDKVVTRTAANELEVKLLSRELLGSGFERVLHSSRYPYAAGDRVAVDGMAVRVLEVGEEGVRRFRMTFDASLDDDRYRLLAWNPDIPGFDLVPVPPTGESVTFKIVRLRLK